MIHHSGSTHRSAPRLIGVLAAAGMLALLFLAIPQSAQAQPGNNAAGNVGTTDQPQTTTPERKTIGSQIGIDPASGALPSLADLFLTSPIINGILVVLSLVALCMFIFFIVTIHPQALAPRAFLDEATRLVIHRQHKELIDFCRSNNRIFTATIVRRCVENADQDFNSIMGIVDSEGKRQAEVVWNRISIMAEIAAVAPMLGLFGTVMGMMNAFFGLEFKSVSAESALLARSIAQAMSTTFFGLAVAILTVALYTFIRSRTTKTLSETEQAVYAVVDHLKRREEPEDEDEDEEDEEATRKVTRRFKTGR